jgi:hypothetical protein
LSIDDAHRIGIDWEKGRRQMIVVGDGSFIPNDHARRVTFQQILIEKRV